MNSLTSVMRRIKPIDDFMEEMSALPQLKGKFAKDQIERLLDELYRCAQQQIQYDIEIENWSTAIPKIRRARKSMGSIKKLIEQAADRFDSVPREYPVEVNISTISPRPTWNLFFRSVTANFTIS